MSDETTQEIKTDTDSGRYDYLRTEARLEFANAVWRGVWVTACVAIASIAFVLAAFALSLDLSVTVDDRMLTSYLSAIEDADAPAEERVMVMHEDGWYNNQQPTELVIHGDCGTALLVDGPCVKRDDVIMNLIHFRTICLPSTPQ